MLKFNEVCRTVPCNRLFGPCTMMVTSISRSPPYVSCLLPMWLSAMQTVGSCWLAPLVCAILKGDVKRGTCMASPVKSEYLSVKLTMPPKRTKARTLFVFDSVLLVYNLFFFQCTMDLSQGSPPKGSIGKMESANKKYQENSTTKKKARIQASWMGNPLLLGGIGRGASSSSSSTHSY